jgi:hypothetical protein
MNTNVKRKGVLLSDGPATEIAAMDEEHAFPERAVNVDEKGESNLLYGRRPCSSRGELDYGIHDVTVWVPGCVVKGCSEPPRSNSFRR